MPYVSLRSQNFPDHFLRHRSFLADLTPVGTALDREDASFELAPGLVGGAPDLVSFRSGNLPTHVLRHQGFRLKLHENNPPLGAVPDQLLLRDATFHRRPGLADAGAASFESVNFPGHFLRHRDFELWLDRADGSPLFRADATFHVMAAFVVPDPVLVH